MSFSEEIKWGRLYFCSFMLLSSWWCFKVKWIGGFKESRLSKSCYSKSSLTYYANKNKKCVIYKCLVWMTVKSSTAELQTNLKILYKEIKCHSKTDSFRATTLSWDASVTKHSNHVEQNWHATFCHVMFHFNWVMFDFGCVMFRTRLFLSCRMTHGLNLPALFCVVQPKKQLCTLSPYNLQCENPSVC